MRKVRVEEFWNGVVVVMTLLLGCRSAPQSDISVPPPKLNDGWGVASPSRFDADVTLLETMVRLVDAGDYVGIHSVLVVKDGVLVLEQYFEGNARNTIHEIRSATKSVGSMLTGIAIDKGFLNSDRQSIYDIFRDDYEPAGGWGDRARQVEIRHLLSMMSGYDCDDHATNFGCEHAMYETDDWVQYALDLPFAYDPGRHWAYNSSSLILVGEAVARGSGMELDEFADRYLFEPLGIDRFRWQVSPRGRAWIGGGARMIPREMAKLGQLMLNRGVWNGERLLSEEWIDKSTKKQGSMLGGVDYGYLWQTGRAYFGNELVTAFWASGNGGQYIIILPDKGLVVVFTGGNFDSPLAGQPFRILAEYIVPAFLRPSPLEAVTLTIEEMNRLVGVYEIDFDSTVTSSVTVHDSRIRLLSPDMEYIDLVAHSPTFFTGISRHGPLTVTFGESGQEVVTLTVCGSFSRYAHNKR